MQGWVDVRHIGCLSLIENIFDIHPSNDTFHTSSPLMDAPPIWNKHLLCQIATKTLSSCRASSSLSCVQSQLLTSYPPSVSYRLFSFELCKETPAPWHERKYRQSEPLMWPSACCFLQSPGFNEKVSVCYTSTPPHVNSRPTSRSLYFFLESITHTCR